MLNNIVLTHSFWLERNVKASICTQMSNQSSFPWILKKNNILKFNSCTFIQISGTRIFVYIFQKNMLKGIYLPSKSTVPESSSSISAIIPSNSWSVNFGSKTTKYILFYARLIFNFMYKPIAIHKPNSCKISFKADIGM